eukprot:gnl/TRDRNA2_/TRDRNA2_143173_c1_seq1.p1 gnl/TRDRNA2_/TRDRNA2_143173_c1~~gnl/TRDRNA2_/TRDRNA2_143173_c1_seq1.p1  ORF type:complete len:724 (-),score=111.61 gnl/TRDRNA2_/TRDRNA2_143173_c1_seq1:108-2123(-)
MASEAEMARWVNQKMEIGMKKMDLDRREKVNTTPDIMFMARSGFWFLIFIFFVAIVYWYGIAFTTRASGSVMSQVLDSLLRAPIDRFYDLNPVGRIMNRFTNDLNAVDLSLYLRMSGVWGIFVSFCVPMFFVHWHMPWAFTFGCIMIYWLLYYLVRLYWNTMVPVKYLMTTSISRITGCLSEVRDECVEARAYNQIQQKQKHFAEVLSHYLKAKFLNNTCMMLWIETRVVTIYAIVMTSLALVGICYPDYMRAGNFALCISNCFAVLTICPASIRENATFQFELIAFQRLWEYTQCPQEKAQVAPGDVALKNVMARVGRSQLGELEYAKAESWEQGEPDMVQVIRRTPEGRIEVVLRQADDGMSLVPGRSFSYADLDRSCEELQDVTSSHSIVAVNGISGDLIQMASAFCSYAEEKVRLDIRSSWLKGGVRVQIEELVCGYASSKDIVRGVSTTIEMRQKFGVVGSTGSGKSTLMMALLRMIEPRSGRVVLNGRDTTEVGLRTLRGAMGLVPQDPLLFAATLRRNLDPFEHYTDESIYGALRLVRMQGIIAENTLQLHAPVADAGRNMSFGQRQLLCIARMILRQPGLLLLDEATSAIDPFTQDVVHSTIHTAFPMSTILAIAHRLETVCDFDQVLVMDRGTIVEKGSVKTLQQNKHSVFSRMLLAQGILA